MLALHVGALPQVAVGQCVVSTIPTALATALYTHLHTRFHTCLRTLPRTCLRTRVCSTSSSSAAPASKKPKTTVVKTLQPDKLQEMLQVLLQDTHSLPTLLSTNSSVQHSSVPTLLSANTH